MEIALVIALILSNLAFLGALLAVLYRVDRFLARSMVYMKSNNISDVLSATSLFPGKEKPPVEENEVVLSDDEEVEDRLIETQKKHRKNHLHALGEEFAG